MGISQNSGRAPVGLHAELGCGPPAKSFDERQRKHSAGLAEKFVSLRCAGTVFDFAGRDCAVFTNDHTLVANAIESGCVLGEDRPGGGLRSTSPNRLSIKAISSSDSSQSALSDSELVRDLTWDGESI